MVVFTFFFFKQKTAYEMRISDWSSDVCSSDLAYDSRLAYPVLIGEPGVGKTAIVEGLAQRIVNNEVPETLKGKRLRSLVMPALLAGAKNLGELEKRLKAVLRELSKDVGPTIAFID